MNLREYMFSIPRHDRAAKYAELAKACNTAESNVRHFVSGQREVKPKYWQAIIDCTDGNVTVHDMLEDATK